MGKKGKTQGGSFTAAPKSGSKSMALYQRRSEAAVLAYHAGQHRRSADEYLLAVQSAPDKWMTQGSGRDAIVTRYHTFHGYTSILREKYFAPDKNDFSVLLNFIDDNEELVVMRVEAALTLALLHYDKGERETTADCYRRGLTIAETASAEELDKKTPGAIGTSMGVYRFEQILKQTCQAIRSNLEILENPLSARHGNPQPHLRSDGTTYESTIRRSFVLGGNPDEIRSCQERSVVGGDKCDRCKRSLAELERYALDVCARCRMAYYCSSACQKAAWRNGHKQACREPGEVHTSDIMRLDGLVSRPELNGMFCKALSEQNNSRWGIELMDGKQTKISVKKENLHRLRPAA